MINVLVIDDEKNARSVIATLLEQYCPEVNIVGEADGVKSGLEMIQQTTPDLVLLDIEMKDGTGFDLLSKLIKPPFKVIFITAYQEYAIRAFKFSALDYILKPLVPENLIAAIERAKSSLDQENFQMKLPALMSNLNDQKEDKKLILKTQDSIYLVKVSEILHCQSDGNYTTFFLEDGRKLVVSRLLKDYEAILKDYRFFRSHQSHLINLNYVLEYLKREDALKLKEGTLVPVSSRKKESLLKALESMI